MTRNATHRGTDLTCYVCLVILPAHFLAGFHRFAGAGSDKNRGAHSNESRAPNDGPGQAQQADVM